jgi:SAM-dependent methyltransferase
VNGIERRWLPARALSALRERGPAYFWHKTMRRSLGRWPTLKRRLVYSDARRYWTLRGGVEYFREQEAQPARTARACWMAARIAAYQPGSILEIGCGYGKQLRSLRERLDCPLVGLDFSASQLDLARGYLDGLREVRLVQGSGDRLPFADRAFDLVLTSAVILHNPPAIAERIRREVLRVGRRWAAHNEDLDVSYNRYGYDTEAWYRSQGYILAESGAIPVDPAGPPTQFCVAQLCRS